MFKSRKTNSIPLILFSIILLPLGAGFVQAADSVPNEFSAGDAVVAADMNANFTHVIDSINTLSLTAGEQRLLEAKIAELEARLLAIEKNTVLSLNGKLILTGPGESIAQFTNVNVQVVDGSGATETTTGLGNLIVGYDEERDVSSDKTGSHNLVVGPLHNYSSSGGFVAGRNNTVSGLFSSVSGGLASEASGRQSSVSGGFRNTASGSNSSVTGGSINQASGSISSVTGGNQNIASGHEASIIGGAINTAGSTSTTILGGRDCIVDGATFGTAAGGSIAGVGCVGVNF